MYALAGDEALRAPALRVADAVEQDRERFAAVAAAPEASHFQRELARVDWSAHEEQSGPADGVGRALRALVEAETADERDRAYWGIENHAVAQSTLYEAAEPVIAVLFGAIADGVPEPVLHAACDVLFLILGAGPSAADAARWPALEERCHAKIREGRWLLVRAGSELVVDRLDDLREYADLAGVYELLVPEALRTPEGSAATFTPILTPGAKVLDCACGTGTLAVGLALAGFTVDATDASPAMVARTRALAREHGVAIEAYVCEWERLWGGPRYDHVLCVGNSLAHARDRVAALRAMAATLLPRATLLVSSRNWERERALGSRTEVDGPVTRTWTIPDDWAQPHYHDIDVGDVHERLTIWPFTHEQLKADLAAADLTCVQSTYSPDVERYSVTARV